LVRRLTSQEVWKSESSVLYGADQLERKGMRIHFVRLQLPASCTVKGETTEKRTGSEGV
jgi:hypothetical protein